MVLEDVLRIDLIVWKHISARFRGFHVPTYERSQEAGDIVSIIRVTTRTSKFV